MDRLGLGMLDGSGDHRREGAVLVLVEMETAGTYKMQQFGGKCWSEK